MLPETSIRITMLTGGSRSWVGISIVTGSASSIGERRQPPAPNEFSPPIISSPRPRSWT
jgi:hypothetical protein